MIYDILMIAVFAGAIIFGMWKGLAWQIASLAAIFVSYFAALQFSYPLSTYISAEEPWNRFAAMLIIFLVCSLAVWLIYGYVRGTIERMRLNGFDRQAGALLGAVKGALLCMVITLFAVTILGQNMRSAIIQSRTGGYIAAGINRLGAVVPDEIHAVLDPHIKEFNQKLDNQDENFIGESQQKLEEKMETFRGKFQFPARPRANETQVGFTPSSKNSNQGSFAPPPRTADSSQNQTGVNWPNIEVNVNSKELFDAAKDTLNNAMDGSRR